MQQTLGERWIRGQWLRGKRNYSPCETEQRQHKYSGTQGEAWGEEGGQRRVGNYRGPERRGL